ncbi:MAG: putative toxin-antitoxin system toxin component, PIN family [Vicinamibacterales bacterium]
MRVVFDANVVVNAVLHPHSAEGRLLDLAISDGCTLLYDDELLREYDEALSRKTLALPPAAVADLIESLADAGLSIPTASRERVKRPAAAGVALDGCADALVTDAGTPRVAHAPQLQVCTAARLLAELL